MAGVSQPIKFVQQPSSHLLCPICKSLFKDPVINTKCGHTFCKECILQDLGGTADAKCPVDAVTCQVDALVVNRALLGQIEDLLIYCPHGLIFVTENDDYVTDVTGCPQKIKYGDRRLHEEMCEYAVVVCPNSGSQGDCGSMRRRELETHLHSCSNYSCPNGERGCSFHGRQIEVSQHVHSCSHRSLQISPQQIQDLARINVQLQNKVAQLTDKVAAMETEKTALQSQVKQCMSQVADLQKKHGELLDRVNHLSLPVRRSPSTGSDSAKTRTASSSVRRSPSASSLSGGRLSPKSCQSWAMPFQFKCIGTLRGHKSSVEFLVSTRSMLFSSGADSVIKVWNMETLTEGCKMTLQGHQGKILALATGAEYLYSGGDDLTLRAWTLTDFTQANIVKDAHAKLISALLCVDDYLFSSSHQEIKVWDTSSLSPLHTISGLYHWVRSLASNPLKDRVYSGSHNTIEIWDALGKFNLKGKISHTYGSVHCLAVTSKYIIAGTYNQNTHLFDVKTQSYLRKLSGHVGAISALTVTANGKFMFTGSNDSTVQLWSLENFLPIQSLSRHEDSVNTVWLHNDLLLTGSEDTEIKVFKYFKMQMGFIPT